MNFWVILAALCVVGFLLFWIYSLYKLFRGLSFNMKQDNPGRIDVSKVSRDKILHTIKLL